MPRPAQGTKPGTMLRYVIENADLTSRVTEEANRMLPILEAAGFKTTKLSVINALGIARRLKGLQPPERANRPHRPRQAKKVQQNPRVEALEGFVDDALKGLQMLKGELRRLKAIERKYLAIKAQLT